ncbi:DUF5017 domain-containing protein [Sphingobacterium sp. SGG-5]|uniref:DUF5017 domain-containing protein n=1 Tax=Sphingobacterium sp. SGG-5 TaxID=2710881 RepID=UPI0019D05B6D|nr:DUF5017 domain-containing protein [Sphingobacterium sp. SGG-5]
MLKKYICLLLAAALLSSCSKTMDLETLDFDAPTREITAKVGEEIKFDLTGSANIVTFYSGELGNDYVYREGRALELFDPEVSFSSNANYGNQEDQLSVLVSTAFNGDFSPENVSASFDAGEWTDITDMFILSSAIGSNGNYNGTTVASGVFDLSDIVGPEKKGLYFAFRNQTIPGGKPTQWTLSQVSVTANTLTGRQRLIETKTGGWTAVELGTPGNPGRPNSSGSAVWFPRGNSPYPAYDNWIVTEKIDFSAKDIGPDMGEPIKSYADPQLGEFKYTYDVPGTYVATFLASNINAEGEVKVVKQVKVIVEP